MSQTNVENVDLTIQVSAMTAKQSVDKLLESFNKLKTAVGGGLGLSNTIGELKSFNTELGNLKLGNIDKLDKLDKLKELGSLKISSSIGNQIKKIGTSVQGLESVNMQPLTDLGTALSPFANMGKANLNSFISQLKRMPEAVDVVNAMDTVTFRAKTQEIAEGLTPFTTLSKNRLTSFITQMGKIPQVVERLDDKTVAGFKSKIKELSEALEPFAEQMQKVSNGFSAFPTKIQKLLTSTNRYNAANKGSGGVGFLTKVGTAVYGMRKATNAIASWMKETMHTIEITNQAAISLGEYGSAANRFAGIVRDVMGIKPSEWLESQSTFMTLARGFGIAGDRAYVMSQNLTQLGYDITSFFDLSGGVAEGMQKLQSAFAGELEPVRRLGYDLSVARLQQEAYNLGITKSVSAMTQAEKAELRYYTLMTQVSWAQGDMARTLDSPTNQLRIFSANLRMTAESLGSLFIPVLQKVLPIVTAIATVLRELITLVGGLFGIKFNAVEWNKTNTSVGNLGGNLSDAAKQAKDLNKALLGIDELNVISKDTGGDNGVNVFGGGLGIDLPTYDFLEGALSQKVTEITNKLKEWLGLTEDIDSWSEFFHTRLGRILITVGAIGLGFAAWKLTESLVKGLPKLWDDIKLFKEKGISGIMLKAGVSLVVTGLSLETAGVADALAEGLNKMNIRQILGGAFTTIFGGSVLGKAIKNPLEKMLSKVFPQALGEAFSAAKFGGYAGLAAAGIPLFIGGLKKHFEDGFSGLTFALTEIGGAAIGAGIFGIVGMLGGPIGALGGALIGGVLGIFAQIGVENKRGADDMKIWFTTKISDAKNWFGEKFNKGKSWFKENASDIVSNFFTGIMTFLHFPQPVIDWGQSVIKWFTDKSYGGVQYDTFGEFAKAVIDGFKTKISEKYTDTKQGLLNWGSGVVNWFKENVNFENFRTNAANTVEGFKAGIREKYETSKANLQTWGTNALNWFKEKSGWNSFYNAASDVINGFKQGVADKKEKALTDMRNFGQGIVNKFKEKVSFDSFRNAARDVIDGFVNGIGSFASSAYNAAKNWAQGILDSFNNKIGRRSPAKEFIYAARDSILGYNKGVGLFGNTTMGVIGKWADSVMRATPVMSFGVDTSSLSFYKGTDFTKSLNSSIYASGKVEYEGFGTGLEKFFTEFLEPLMKEMARDIKRQADKEEITKLNVDGRELASTVNKQQKTNGYVFAK